MSKSKIFILGFVFLIAAFAMVYLIGCGDSSSESESPSPTVSPVLFFAAAHEVDGHVVDALKENGVSISQVQEEHEIVHDEPKNIRFSQIIKKYIDGGKGVILINAEVEHRRALREHVGISFGDHVSRGFFVTALPNTYGREFVIIDHPRVFPLKASDMSAMTETSSETPLVIDEEQLAANQADFEEEIRTKTGPSKFAKAVVARMLENKKMALNGASRDVTPPPYLKYRKWYVDQTESPMMTWKYSTSWMQGYPNSSWWCPAPAPMSGWQQGTYGHTTLITLYLDNDPNNVGEDFQWLTIDHQGWWDTVDGNNHSNDGSGTVQMPLSKDKDTKYEVLNVKHYKMFGWGWGVMAYYFKFQTPGSETQNLKYVSGIPQNQITNTTKNESASFNVGFSKAGVSSSFTVSKSISTNVPSWQVDVSAQPSASSFNWLWHSNDPDWEKNKIQGFNTLITDGYEPPAYGTLQTLSVIDRIITFDMGYGVSKITTAARYYAWPENDHYRHDVKMTNDFQFDINFGAVLYPLVQKVTISPSFVVGGESVTGTVTIDQNAPAGGVVVDLSSNNTNWATVPDTVTIPEGQGAQTFTITTIPVTSNSNVTITATLNKIDASADLSVQVGQ